MQQLFLLKPDPGSLFSERLVLTIANIHGSSNCITQVCLHKIYHYLHGRFNLQYLKIYHRLCNHIAEFQKSLQLFIHPSSLLVIEKAGRHMSNMSILAVRKVLFMENL